MVVKIKLNYVICDTKTTRLAVDQLHRSDSSEEGPIHNVNSSLGQTLEWSLPDCRSARCRG